MTPDVTNVITYEDHMNACMEAFEKAWRAKYTKGQHEHGGRLWRKRTTPFLIEEVLDFVSYVAVLAPQLNRATELLGGTLDMIEGGASIEDIRDQVNRAHNLLTIGNEEGIPEDEF
jgi:hypothetical protein